MSGFNPENFSEGDWDDKGEIAWNEFDWQRYLKQSEEETARFLTHYAKLRGHPQRLDEVAFQMGWEREDWAPLSTDEREENDFERLEAAEEEEESDDFDPYTIHRHPVFVVARGLFGQLSRGWEFFLNKHGSLLDPRHNWSYMKSLHAGEINMIMAVHAMDMGDFTLCVCHLKHALAAINTALRLLEPISRIKDSLAKTYHRDALEGLFDLRELSLRVMKECRDESR